MSEGIMRASRDLKRSVMVLVACVTMASAGEPFKDGERVCMFGDSVTHWGGYVGVLQKFYYTRYPERDIRIWNCGTGGATAGEVMSLVNEDVVSKNPTHVSILFGMNDVGVDCYRLSAPQWRVGRRPRLIEDFRRNLPRLHGMLVKGAPQATYTFSTLVPWDDRLKFRDRMDDVPLGVTAAEKPFCEFVKEYHAKVGGVFVDYYTPMLAWNTEHQKTDPYVSLSPDRIHTRAPGALFMANLFLRAHGEPGVVSDVVVDAASLKIEKSENASVTRLARLDCEGVRFTMLENALPYPLADEVRMISDEIGFGVEMNRELLSVRGLGVGDWKLVIDGTNEVLTASSADWAKGVDLSNRETPMVRQARIVCKMVDGRMAKEFKLRNLWVDRNVMWRRLSLFGDLFKPTDCDDPRVYKAFCMGAKQYYGDKNPFDEVMYGRMLKDWEKRDRMIAEIEKDHLAIRTMNATVSHTFELVKVGCAR